MLAKVEKFLSKVMGGSSTERELKRLEPLVAEINAIAEDYQHLTDDELKAKTNEFRYRLLMGETLDDLLPEAFAAVKDTCRRLLGKTWSVRGQETEWNMVPYDVQIMGGVVLHEGKIAEMATGEGKTLVATMPLYLNALEGKGAHLITVNDYLAQRDCEWMGEIYKFLGLTVSAAYGDQSPEERKKAYQTDITYGTNNEFGFDYLRDNMTSDIWSVVQRPLHYAIVDEVDSVLIDEARTPLIISGSVGAPRNVYNELKPVVESLYRRQQELVEELLRKGKELLESDEEQAGLMILRAQRGDPKNQKLLELLTSEFWVKKLIERIQGQFEINKDMATVDQELFYTIDEKSHVVDITEKGRIFLSGGRDQDVVQKIQTLDTMDDTITRISEQKNRAKFFTQDAVTGQCNGLSFEGKIALNNISGEYTDTEKQALDELHQRLQQMAENAAQDGAHKKGDRSSGWRRYFKLTKKMDRAVNGLTDEGKKVLTEQGNPALSKMVDALDAVLTTIRQQADVDAGQDVSRAQQDNRRALQTSFFETDKQVGCPMGLTDQGRIAIIVTLFGGDPLNVPLIFNLEELLKADDPEEKTRDYFEFSDDGATLKHIAEKGRIALLGGNPDLYVLPDRSIVEERDRQIQQLLDRTLNQTSFDYSAQVIAVEQLETDIRDMYTSIEHTSENNRTALVEQFYQLPRSSDVGQRSRLQLTNAGKAFLSDFAEQTRDVVSQLDTDLRKFKGSLDQVFLTKDGSYVGLHPDELGRLVGASFSDLQNKIQQWQNTHSAAEETSSISLRRQLDEFIGDGNTLETSLSRRFEEVQRIAHVFENIFRALGRTDISDSEKRRIVRRYFEFSDDIKGEMSAARHLPISGLTDAGVERLAGNSAARLQIADRLYTLLDDPDVEYSAVFDLSDEGIPKGLRKTARSHLVDGLPFFSYREGLKKFRDEILHLSSKKVSNRSELQSLLPKEKAHLRGKHYLFDDREMNELLSNIHLPTSVLTAEEIESWFRLQFDRQPRRILEARRDRLWRNYSQVEERIQNISQLLRAYTLYHRDVEYVVKAPEEGEMRRHGGARGQKAVMIVDQFTGRLMPGRRFSDGLHEALEAKEGVQVQAETQTLATITLQNFFRIYDKLAGMTGTAETEAQEFFSTYKLDVIVVPTNRPVIRDDHDDVIYRTKREKYNAIIDEALEMHNQGRPVLIGTISVDVSQHLSDLFTARGIPVADWLKKGDVTKQLESGKFHTVLNAKYHKNEAEIVAKAGFPGAITIATNMAGRGTDIKLAPGVKEKGGLHIIGSEKHEARRIDRQLRGRAGRQGDPGSSRFYLSLEDDLMRLFGSDRITNIMSSFGSMEEGERIEHSLITKSIERAQKKVEERNFEIRKNLLEYDDVLNEQRKIIYKRRQNLLGFAQPQDFVESKLKKFIADENDRSTWDLPHLLEDLQRYFGKDPGFEVEELERGKYDQLRETLLEWVTGQIEQRKHFHQLQERHRIFGYCEIQDILDHLVNMKVRLHNAGTRDTSKWNVEGIKFELNRIFGTEPDWLPDEADALGDVDDVMARLTQWARDLYVKQQSQHEAAFDELMFSHIDFERFLDIYLIGLVQLHLPPREAAINWRTEEFLRDLERVFGEAPKLGVNEMRSIRMSKIVKIVRDWLKSLQISPEQQKTIKHRIFGYFTTLRLVDATVAHLFSDRETEPEELSASEAAFLKDVFGRDFQISTNGKQESAYAQLVRQAREAYLQRLDEHLEAYDAIMLAKATNEELIEASLHAVVESIVEEQAEQTAAQKQFTQTLERMFLNKPDQTFPAQRDATAIASFTEDVVAWGHSFYKMYSDRVERLQQEELSSEIVSDSVLGMIDDTVYAMIGNVLGNDQVLDSNQMLRLEGECRLVFRQSPRLYDEGSEGLDPNLAMEQLGEWAKNQYYRRVHELGKDVVTRLERYYVLEKIDETWRQHLSGVDELREGIGLRGYGQKDPLLEYKREAFRMFERTIDAINRETVGTLFKVFDVGGEIEEQAMRRVEPQSFTTSHSQVEVFKQVMSAKKQQQTRQAAPAPGSQPAKRQPVVKTKNVGRNDPCPCGSGKKYKNCCGKVT